MSPFFGESCVDVAVVRSKAGFQRGLAGLDVVRDGLSFLGGWQGCPRELNVAAEVTSSEATPSLAVGGRAKGCVPSGRSEPRRYGGKRRPSSITGCGWRGARGWGR